MIIRERRQLIVSSCTLCDFSSLVAKEAADHRCLRSAYPDCLSADAPANYCHICLFWGTSELVQSHNCLGFNPYFRLTAEPKRSEANETLDRIEQVAFPSDLKPDLLRRDIALLRAYITGMER